MDAIDAELLLLGGSLLLAGGPPPPEEPDPLPLAGAVAGFVAGPLRLVDPAAIPITCTVVRLNRDAPLSSPSYAHVVDLPDSFGRRFQEPVDDAGSGALSLWNTDPALGDIEMGDIVQVKLYGSVVGAWIIENRRRTIIDTGEESAEVTVLSGGGVDLVLERGRVWPTGGVRRRPIEIDRLWNWTSPAFNHDGWIAGVELCSVDEARNGEWPYLPMAGGFPEGSGAQMVWAPGTTSQIAPEGDVYLWDEVTTGSGRIMLYLLIDNHGEVYFDGQLVATIRPDDGFTQVTTVPLDVSAGEHYLAIWGHNFEDDGPPGGNPGAIAYAVYDTNQANSPQGSPLLVSSSGARIVPYPDEPPGMTLGEIGRLSLSEPQGRSGVALAGIGRSFTDDTDSEGRPWDARADIGTKVGTGVHTFWRELSGAYIDFRLRPGQPIVDYWHHKARGHGVSATLYRRTDPEDPTTGNLVALSSDETGYTTNTFLVLSHRGWDEVLDAGDVADDGRSEELLGLGAQHSFAEARRIARKQLAVYSQARLQLRATVVPTSMGEIPWLAYECGDTLADVDGLGPMRVTQIEVREDEEGNVTFPLLLHDRFLTEADQTAQAIQKYSAGVLRGDSRVATPAALVDVALAGPNCCPPVVNDDT